MIDLTIFILIVLFFSIVIHEIAHGSVALWLGDSTAKLAGRLTLNPIKHIDPFGTIILPAILILTNAGFIFGWAKPVPINPFNFRDQKWGALKVALAGPLVNFIIAIFFGLIIRFVPLTESLFIPFSLIAFYNLFWGIFNLVPIPPLDGSHILFALLPKGAQALKSFLSQYGLVLLVLVIFVGVDFLFNIASLMYFFITGNKF